MSLLFNNVCFDGEDGRRRVCIGGNVDFVFNISHFGFGVERDIDFAFFARFDGGTWRGGGGASAGCAGRGDDQYRLACVGEGEGVGEFFPLHHGSEIVSVVVELDFGAIRVFFAYFPVFDADGYVDN